MDAALRDRLTASIADDFDPGMVRDRAATELVTVSDDAALRERLPPDTEALVVVTGPGPVRELLDRVTRFDQGRVLTVQSPTMAEVEAVRERIDDQVDRIVGFGGGSVIDVAKQSASDLDTGFTAVPTACSHDGAFSSRASLYAGSGTGVRQSQEATAADRVIAPAHMWEAAPYRLWTAGQLDVLANLTALQDVSLARQRGAHPDPSRLHRDAATHAVRCLLDHMDGGRTGDLAEALLFSGIAMRSRHGSVYASGFEHELERYVRDVCGVDALHGQVVGLMTLASARLYRENSGQLPSGLLFDPEELYAHVREGITSIGQSRGPGFEPLIAAIADAGTGLDEIAGLRQRYTLRRELDLGEIDLARVCQDAVDD